MLKVTRLGSTKCRIQISGHLAAEATGSSQRDYHVIIQAGGVDAQHNSKWGNGGAEKNPRERLFKTSFSQGMGLGIYKTEAQRQSMVRAHQGIWGAQSLRGDEGDHSKRPLGRSVGEGGKGSRIEIYCAQAVPTKNKTKITTPVGPCLRRGDC